LVEKDSIETCIRRENEEQWEAAVKNRAIAFGFLFGVPWNVLRTKHRLRALVSPEIAPREAEGGLSHPSAILLR
jgi:hypothetical protein